MNHPKYLTARALRCGLVAALFYSSTSTAFAGFLWLSAEFAEPTSIYRYNLQTGIVDSVVQPSFGGEPLDPTTDVYNNLAYDGTNLYLGTDDNDLFATADPLNGAVLQTTTYSPTPDEPRGWEDGAFNLATGNLWRAGTEPHPSNNRSLLETTVTGSVVNRFEVDGVTGLAGLEWIDDMLYATTFDAFGSISFSGATATFNEIFGLGTVIPPGYPTDHSPQGLALDQETGFLYMASSNTIFGGSENFLWRVEPEGGTATFVRDLVAAGYPARGAGDSPVFPDAMGWVPANIPEPSTLVLLVLGSAGLFTFRRRIMARKAERTHCV